MISVSGLGAFFAYLGAVHWGDTYGRRRLMLWATSLLLVGGIGQVSFYCLAIGLLLNVVSVAGT